MHTGINVEKNDAPMKEAPHFSDVERSLLGSILINNDIYASIEDLLFDRCFYEQLHCLIFEAISKLIARGLIANHLTVKAYIADKELIKSGDIDIDGYLSNLIQVGELVLDAMTLAKLLHDAYIRRGLIGIGNNIVNTSYKNDLDIEASAEIEQAEVELFKLASDASQGSDGSSMALHESVTKALSMTEAAYNNKDELSGVPTGFEDLDRLLGGMQNSDLLILAARPSMGKTALSVNFAMNACELLLEKRTEHEKEAEGKKEKHISPGVVFFSLEMSAEQLALRMLSMKSGINSSRMRSGLLNEDDFGKIVYCSKGLNSLPFYIDDTPALTISSLRTRARRFKRKYDVGIIFVDYLQLIRGTSNQSASNRVQEVSEVTQGLKAIAKELEVPVIALSQLSRSVEQREDKRPQLSDLRDSGTIEQDADVVMFIFREEYYEHRKQPSEGTEKHEQWQEKMESIMNKTDVIIAKQRNGPIGNIRLHFDSNTTKFSNFIA